MIDRLAALADIVPPLPPPAPAVAGVWHGPWVWVFGVALVVVLAACLPWLQRRLRVLAARRRFVHLARQIREGAPGAAPEAAGEMARRLLAAAQDAGLKPDDLPPNARARCQCLLYARAPEPALLTSVLDDLERR